MAMIDSQLRTSGVFDRNVLRGMADLPRERFVASHRQAVAYVDDLQWLAGGTRFLLSPAQLGRIVQLAKIDPDDVILDVGAATGYSTALVAGFARSVIGIEPDQALADHANMLLQSLSISHAEVLAGGPERVADEAFDVILVQGALDAEPQDLLALLKMNGRMVVPILRKGVAVVHVFKRTAQGVMFTSEFDATMPLLWSAAVDQEFIF